jgi:hypothetical protein
VGKVSVPARSDIDRAHVGVKMFTCMTGRGLSRDGTKRGLVDARSWNHFYRSL